VDAVWLAIVGLVAGFFGGLLGIGGSIVMIPAMTMLLGPRQHLYQAAAMIVNFFVAVPSVIQHVRAGAVQPRLLRKLIPFAAVGAVVGVACSELPAFREGGDIYLTGVFGVFLVVVGVRGVLISRTGRQGPDGSPNEPSRQSLSRVVFGVGLPTGFISGLLGVGGGVLAVPLQRNVLRIPTRSAIANSAATIIALSVVGATAKHYGLYVNHPDIALHQPVALAAYLIPTAIVGASIGSRLTHVLPVHRVKFAFALLVVVAGVRLSYMAFS
jgi:uncharacterized protein